MKFVHIADMHFDVPFTSLNSREDLGEKRRLEQRDVFKKVIEYIKKNNVDYFFISGDLYEHEYVKKSTIEFISDEFKKIPNTKVFISPGNHDPYIKNSYYDIFYFGDNVYIFNNSRIERYEDENVNIYGMAFTEFYMNTSDLSTIKIPKSNKPNILLAHCDLNGGRDENGFLYNPIIETTLNNIGFDYCAIGHIHKTNYGNRNRIYYPGSPISLGFDELGDHGMIVGEITKDNFYTDFVILDERKFEEFELNVEAFNSKEALIENINDLNLNKNHMYKIVLVGKRNFEINTREILKFVIGDNVLKIKDNTKLNYDIEEIAKQNNLRGIFVRKVLDAYNSGLCNEEEFQKAIEIGLEVM